MTTFSSSHDEKYEFEGFKEGESYNALPYPNVILYIDTLCLVRINN